MSNNTLKIHKSFTLVEVFIVMGISVILVAIVLTAMMQMQAIFTATDISSNLQTNGRLAMRRLAADFRRVDASDTVTPLWYQIAITQDSPVSGSDSITYYLPQDTTPLDGTPDTDANGDLIWSSTNISVSLDTNTSQLIRNTGGTEIVLANNVESVNFIDHTIDSTLPLDNLRVSLALKKTDAKGRDVNVDLTSIVDMRN